MDTDAYLRRIAYQVIPDGAEWTVLRSGNELGGRWEPQYRFALRPHRLDEFAAMCRYHQTSPDSPFTQRRVCSHATPEGRITLRDKRLIVTTHGEKTERALKGEAAYRPRCASTSGSCWTDDRPDGRRWKAKWTICRAS